MAVLTAAVLDGLFQRHGEHVDLRGNVFMAGLQSRLDPAQVAGEFGEH